MCQIVTLLMSEGFQWGVFSAESGRLWRSGPCKSNKPFLAPRPEVEQLWAAEAHTAGVTPLSWLQETEHDNTTHPRAFIISDWFLLWPSPHLASFFCLFLFPVQKNLSDGVVSTWTEFSERMLPSSFWICALKNWGRSEGQRGSNAAGRRWKKIKIHAAVTFSSKVWICFVLSEVVQHCDEAETRTSVLGDWTRPCLKSTRYKRA